MKVSPKKRGKSWHLEMVRRILNPFLIWLDKPLITYVIMHEMCHLKYQNLSKFFYSFLDMVIPEWEFCERKLEGIA